MDRFQLLANDQLLYIDAVQNAYSRHFEGIKNYGDVVLRKSGRKTGPSYYYKCDPDNRARTYLGTDSNRDVMRVKEARFCREIIRRAEKDKALLTHLISEYLPLDYESVNACLPRTYRGAEIVMKSRTRPDRRVEEWKKQKEALKRSVIEKHSENLRHTAIDGTIVRSKSELIIANMLFLNNIPYVYECPYFFDGGILKFDFTALSTIDYESEVIIEHQGMMNMSFYQDKYMHSLMTCLGNGIVPNIDIFFTFDDLEGNFDSQQIWDIIKTRLIK